MTDSTATPLVVPLRDQWRFHKGNPFRAATVEFDDSQWRTVRVPHDWAIEGPFHREYDLQHTMIWEDGERKPSEHTGRTGGLPHVGMAWYRRAIQAPPEWEGKRVFIEFDGVMSHSTVFMNGQRVGSWPYGYASFCFEMTDYLRPGESNMLAVRVDNKPDASRWYPGAGIYRHVRLVVLHPVHVAHWGTCVRTMQLSTDTATIEIRTTIQNQSGSPQSVTVEHEVCAPDGLVAARGESTVSADVGAEEVQSLSLAPVLRWDVDTPQLYRLVTRLLVDGAPVDERQTPFGLREVRFDANEGFFLNGRSLKLNGVCMHHDLGALGTAMNRCALRRQLETLKQMGCNAIRTSHNPPAPELLDLCDEMGFLVIDEAFDEWRVAKVANGYHTLFDDWAEKDLVAMIRRDRNHPCVLMWSIGNEIGEQGREDGAGVAQFLRDICHREDPTRPVTAGFNNSDAAIENGLADVVDIPGWNYKPFKYQEYHAAHPQWPMYGSETESCVSSRGEYYLPAEEAKDKQRDTLHCSSYDLEAPPWGYSPDVEFLAQDDCPFMMGEFVWTGWDYLGEPTPYKQQWPSRSSYFGIIDLAGIPKDRFYLYRSKWSDQPTLHLLPHWNWEGHEGEPIPVHCYTSYDAAELFLNGRSLGVRHKDRNSESPFRRYRLIWDGVPYEPGELKVVGLDAGGSPAAETCVRTAGAPARIALAIDRKQIAADGDDLCFVTATITDSEGVPCPHADNTVRFNIDGPIEIAGVDNGDPTSLESFQAPERKAFNGRCVAILRAIPGESGTARLTASADGLSAESVTIACVDSGAPLE